MSNTSSCNPYHTRWTLCFRCVVIGTNHALQTAVRDSTGFLNDPIRQINERDQVDALTATTIRFICEHVDEYIDFEVEALHADMPQRHMFKFSSLAERIKLMLNSTTVAGEVEIMATSKVLKRSVSVSNTHHDTVFRYGEDVFPNEFHILVQYTQMGEYAGHYESIVAKSPSHTDGGKLENVP